MLANLWVGRAIALCILFTGIPWLAAAQAPGMTEVRVANGAWGRMARLADGRWLSVGTHYTSRETSLLQIRVSADNARTWVLLSQVAEEGRKLDNGELIQLPDGSVLLTGRSLIDNRSYRLPVYRSADDGAHWSYLSAIETNEHVINGNKPSQGLWEPVFFLLPDGRLAAAYSTEKHSIEKPAYSQICALRVSPDRGATWGPEIVLAAQPGGGELRPGMPVVRRMRDGRYIEVSEVVGDDNAQVYYKISPNGVTWPSGLGTPIPGQHAGPFVAPLADGRVAVTSCANVVAYSGDYGKTWQQSSPVWDIGFVLSWPAIYQTAPDEIAVMNTHGDVNIRFARLLPKAAAVARAGRAGPIDVYLIGGQSNATGQGYMANLPNDVVPDARVLLFNSGKPHLDSGAEPTTWLPLRQASESPDRFGPELGFGNRLQELMPRRKIALIKHAHSGTSLFSDWNPGAGSGDQEHFGPQYRVFVDTVELGLKGLRDQGYNPTIRGMIWQQGENDAVENAALDYGKNLAHFIARVREQFHAPRMLFVYGYVLPPPGVGIERELVRKGEEQVDQDSASPLAVKGAFVVETDDLSQRANDPNTPYPDDHVHFGTAGTLELGRRMADKMAAQLHLTK